MKAREDGDFRITRIQLNVVARKERQLLTWICSRLPRSATPDRLTGLSILGAVLVLVGAIASRQWVAFLWLSSFGLVLNWFGDSLDGSLARYRSIERPAYGYFLDHTVDALNNLVIMVGMGCTIAVRMDVALFALAGYYLLCMYVFITNHLSGVFKLSFLGFGPTELRIFLIGINTAILCFGRVGMTINGQFVSIYDALIGGTGIIFVGIFLTFVLVGLRDFRDLGRLSTDTASGQGPQSLKRNASSSAK